MSFKCPFRLTFRKFHTVCMELTKILGLRHFVKWAPDSWLLSIVFMGLEHVKETLVAEHKGIRAHNAMHLLLAKDQWLPHTSGGHIRFAYPVSCLLC